LRFSYTATFFGPLAVSSWLFWDERGVRGRGVSDASDRDGGDTDRALYDAAGQWILELVWLNFSLFLMWFTR
jgi:hypothetical protein